MNIHKYEVRDPIHGMIAFSDLEREIINTPPFQRLRRIRQLSWSDYVYPGAMHTRFQHTLGVMHLASTAFDALVREKHSKEILAQEFGMTDAVHERQRVILRLAALVHDLGHSPFSHAGENLMPIKAPALDDDEGTLFKHEEYSVAIFKHEIFPLIKLHHGISSMNITCDEIVSLIDPQNTSATQLGLLCKEIISGRIDADRMDYLLRDSYYCGVRYGHYELERLLNTMCVCEDPEDGSFSVGIREDGLHAAEGLFLARYMMFHNVYYHKTRVIYDYHFQMAMRELLGGKPFPAPLKPTGVQKYLKWDDWKVLGLLAEGKGGEHGEIIRSRRHYRLAYQTSESHPSDQKAQEAFSKFEKARLKAKSAPHFVWSETKSFSSDLLVLVTDSGIAHTKPLLELSGVVKSLRPLNQKRLYVSESNFDSVSTAIATVAQ